MGYHKRQANNARAKYNLETKLYDVLENGIQYSMPLEILRSLNTMLGHNGRGDELVSDWYRDLSNEDKESVKIERIGPSIERHIPPAVMKKINPQDNDTFYPDITYDD